MFYVALHDVDKHHGGSYYIYAADQFIPIKFYLDLMYVTIKEHT